VTRYRTQKIVKKSMIWSRHGKHSKIDPALIHHDRRRPAYPMQWFGSIRDLFRGDE
jgi:hypothetical protein